MFRLERLTGENPGVTYLRVRTELSRRDAARAIAAKYPAHTISAPAGPAGAGRPAPAMAFVA